MDCLFCKIASGDIPSTKVYEDDMVLAFRDIAPQAPVHVLVIPKKELRSLDDVEPEDAPLIGHIFAVIRRLARELGIAEGGYRVVSNCGQNAMQTVPHLHFHLIGGRGFAWPPG